jgi:hypothetical protein
MPGFILHTGAVMNCPHVAPVTIPPSQNRVTVSGQFVATESDQLTVEGCLFQIPTPGGPVPQPCVPVQWANISTRVTVDTEFVLLQAPATGTGNGICFSATAIPAGPPNVTYLQQRVIGV